MSHLMKSHRVRPEGGGSPAHERQSPRLMVWDPPPIGWMSSPPWMLSELHATEIVRIFFFFVFLLFLGPLPRHMEVPRLGVQLEL